MNYTTYYKLQKPLGTEQYDIEVHNANSDIIDSALNQFTEIQNQYATKEELNALSDVVGQANALLESI